MIIGKSKRSDSFAPIIQKEVHLSVLTANTLGVLDFLSGAAFTLSYLT